MTESFRVLAIVLAGGEGKRLSPLTRDRAKPAVPFGGQYRLIDFALSNLVNGGFRRIVVLTQYKSHSLNRHLARTWSLSGLVDEYVATVPAQMRMGRQWFLGSADAIYQNLNIIHDERPDYVLLLGADHVYRMDPRQFLRHHVDSGASVTVAALPAPIEQADQLGVIDANADGRIRGFQEKPASPAPMPGDATRVLGSMGNYVFTTNALIEAVSRDAEDTASRHDVGGNIVPWLVEQGLAGVYDFTQQAVPGDGTQERGYWRDVGTIDAYFEASMDLVAPVPEFNFYNSRWPILSWHFHHPPAKFVHRDDGSQSYLLDSLVCGGAIVAGGAVRRAIVSPGVHIHDGALVEDAVLFDNVVVEPGAVVRRAIVDKNVRVPRGFHLSAVSPDVPRGFTMSAGGVLVVGKGDTVG